jgi:predicted cobalt transporter CbtA
MTPGISSASRATEEAIMVGNLLLRGMLAGVIAGLIAFAFARVYGEPYVDMAIAFEDQQSKAASQGQPQPAAEEPEIVSRDVQASVGLATGILVYGAAVGGLFALAFACLYGRLGRLGPRETAALLALGGFLAVVLIPFLKYPPNPPAIGDPETIGVRTQLFGIMLLISLGTLAVAVALARRLWTRHGGWNAAMIAGAAALLIIVVAYVALPDINEVPEQFSATLLYHFRLASLGIHAILWAALGLLFGLMTERSLSQHPGRAAFATR